uniref:GK21561 n=1 Tax=Drosophila willistoni TaxID=7260 RepID=B4MPP8_DROWI
MWVISTIGRKIKVNGRLLHLFGAGATRLAAVGRVLQFQKLCSKKKKRERVSHKCGDKWEQQAAAKTAAAHGSSS